jgi:hypothetical protein
MKRKYNKLLITLSIVAVLFAAGVTAVHHHLPNDSAHNKCEICSFINAVNSAVLSAILLLCVISVVTASILLSNNKIYSQYIRTGSSRAPPYIPV